MRTCKDHNNKEHTHKLAEFRIPSIERSVPSIERSVCPAYLLEPTPGTHCPLASGVGTNIFSAALLLAQVLTQFEFCNVIG